MLPKNRRLASNYEYRRVMRIGRAYHTPLFILFLTPAKNDQSLSRFGVVCSKKIDKRAVVRNRLRRWFHRAVGSLLEQIPAGFELVFLAKRPIISASYEEIYHQLAQVLPKVAFTR